MMLFDTFKVKYDVCCWNAAVFMLSITPVLFLSAVKKVYRFELIDVLFGS